jgi:hypothetical protein
MLENFVFLTHVLSLSGLLSVEQTRRIIQRLAPSEYEYCDGTPEVV